MTSTRLDLNIGWLVLTFSDVVNVSTQYPQAIRLQSKRLALADEVYTLTEDSRSSGPDAHTVVVDLSDVDLLGINSIPGLARNVSTLSHYEG